MSVMSPGFKNKILSQDKLGYVLLLANIVFLYIRPQEILTFIRPLRLSGILSLLLLLWFLINFKTYLLNDKYIRRIVILIGVFLVCSIGAVNVVGYRRVIHWSTVYLPMMGSIFLLVCTPERIKHFFKFMCFIFLFAALITIKNKGYGPGDFIYDENDTALFLGMGIPITFYLAQWNDISKGFKRLALLTSLALFVAVIITQSRGGLVGLAMVFGVMWLFSKRKMSIAISGTLLLIVSSGVIYSLLPEGYVEDVMSGFTNSDDSTRVERFRSWEISWLMFLDNFLLGVGPGNFPYNVGPYQVQTSWWVEGMTSLEGRQVHSLYFEILADTGIVGTLTYFSAVSLVFFRSWRTQKILKGNTNDEQSEIENIAWICRGLVGAVTCFMFSGLFISVSYYPHVPMLLALASIVFRYHDNLVQPEKPRTMNERFKAYA